MPVPYLPTPALPYLPKPALPSRTRACCAMSLRVSCVLGCRDDAEACIDLKRGCSRLLMRSTEIACGASSLSWRAILR